MLYLRRPLLDWQDVLEQIEDALNSNLMQMIYVFSVESINASCFNTFVA